MNTKQRGFTVLELMFAIALLAVLVGIGVPALRDFVRNSRMVAASNDIITDFNLARSEAVKRRVAVTLCKSQNLETCDADDEDPFRSWIVFVDDADPAVIDANDGNGEVDDDEVILRRRSLPETITVVTAGDQIRSTFLPSGFPAVETERVAQMLLCDERGNVAAAGGNSAARGVEILPTGRPSVFRDVGTVASYESALGDCP